MVQVVGIILCCLAPYVLNALGVSRDRIVDMLVLAVAFLAWNSYWTQRHLGDIQESELDRQEAARAMAAAERARESLRG